MSLVRTRRKMKQMMIAVWAFVILFILSIFIQGQFGNGGSEAAPGERLFARAGDYEITNAEFDAAMRQTENMFSMGGPLSIQTQASLPGYAYEGLLRQYAQAAAADANRVSVSRGEAQKEARRQVDEWLKQMGEGLSREELADLRAQRLAHIDTEGIRRQLAAQRLREKFAKEARPVEVKVAHVLVKTDKRSDADALALAREIAAKARAGQDFAKLAKQYSEDEGSKGKDGVVGWASAQPPDPTAKPGPDAPGSFVPEFTSAALRTRVGQITDPVRSDYGYHVLKVLEERDFKPKADAAKDDKKRQEAIDAYKSSVADRIVEGLLSEHQKRLAARIEAHSPWLRGYLKEQESDQAMLTVAQGEKKSGDTALTQAIAAYEEEMKAGGPASGPGLAYKLVQLHQRAKQHDQALALLDKWAEKSYDPEMLFLHGEALEKAKRKTDALTVYQKAMKQAYNNPDVLRRLKDRFKALGRNDLAQKAGAEEVKVAARQEAERKRQAEQMAKFSTQQAEQQDASASQEITIDTGEADAKSGKPETKEKPAGGS